MEMSQNLLEIGEIIMNINVPHTVICFNHYPKSVIEIKEGLKFSLKDHI